MPIHLPHPPPDLIFDTEIQSLHSVIASAVRCSQNKGPSACLFGENASLLGCYSTLISVLSFQWSFNKVMMQKASLPRCPFFRHFMKWSQGSLILGLHVAKQIVTNRVKRHSTFGHNHPIFHLPTYSLYLSMWKFFLGIFSKWPPSLVVAKYMKTLAIFVPTHFRWLVTENLQNYFFFKISIISFLTKKLSR